MHGPNQLAGVPHRLVLTSTRSSAIKGGHARRSLTLDVRSLAAARDDRVTQHSAIGTQQPAVSTRHSALGTQEGGIVLLTTVANALMVVGLSLILAAVGYYVIRNW